MYIRRIYGDDKAILRVYDPIRNQVIRTSTVKFVESKKRWAAIIVSSGNDPSNEGEDSEGDGLVDLNEPGGSVPGSHNSTGEQQPHRVQQDLAVGGVEKRSEAVSILLQWEYEVKRASIDRITTEIREKATILDQWELVAAATTKQVQKTRMSHRAVKRRAA